MKTMQFLYKLFVISIFWLYIIILMYLLFFSAYRQRVQGEFDYNLVPFVSIFRDMRQMNAHLEIQTFTNNLVGNILAFFPFGLLLPLIWKRGKTFWRTGLLAFGLSLTIETLQIYFRVGAFDVDDIILNTAGAVSGWMIIRVILYIRKKFT
ncbi:VanZ family protein [Peribacillus kribbensis]|uniref:VanZ family protein n=1 Tax=Peribacillus kribbensis TaxID=356658 RepID=UPI000683DE69|nr:VanZ family protein [Peribacillus kribbensis]